MWSLVSPADFDWRITRNIKTADELDAESKISAAVSSTEDSPDVEKSEKEATVDEVVASDAQSVASVVSYTQTSEFAGLVKAFRFASYSALSLLVCLLIVSERERAVTS